MGALGLLIAGNICIRYCKAFANRKPYNVILLIIFTILECFVAAWFAAIFFEGTVVPLLLGCGAITSFLIIGVTWFYNRGADDEQPKLQKAEGIIRGAADMLNAKLDGQVEEPAENKGNNSRMFYYVLCGVFCLATVILTCVFDLKTQWWHCVLVCMAVALWIYIFVENVVIIMSGERDEDRDSYIVGARTVYGNFLSSSWILIQFLFEFFSTKCCKKKEANQEAEPALADPEKKDS